MYRSGALKIFVLLVFVGTRQTSCLPQPDSKVPTSDNSDSIIDLPFLQIKNGGIRVNFAGYHAEAGLGGLLGGPNAKGGLYASAGTPWGPSASAGLGGNLGGEDGTAGGGLHARAGVGNGGPEAAAGLGGNLDGSGRSGSRARGGLYAGATPGGRPLFGKVIGDPVAIGAPPNHFAISNTAQGEQDFNVDEKKPSNDGSHIQAIAPPATGEKVYLAKAGVKEPTTTLEFKLPATNKRASNLIEEIPKSEIPGPFAPVTDVHEIPQITHANRRYYRKLLRGNPARKSGFYKYLIGGVGIPAEPAVEPSSPDHATRIVERQAIENQSASARADVPYGIAPHPRNPTLFDNIFNIPISTLAAVNQLLNSKYG